jgi:hypothetical protein
MASKWDWIRKRYPTLTESPEYEDVIAAAKDEYRTLPLNIMAERINALEEAKEIKQRELADLDVGLVALERLMIDGLDREGIEKIKVGGYNFSIQPAPTSKIVDPQAWMKYITETQPEILTVNAQTRNSMVARALEAGETIPPGLEVHVRESLSRKK